MIRLKYELTLTRHILSRIITLKYVAAYRLLISRAGLNKQKESGNETQVENASELRQRQSLWGGRGDYTLGLLGKAHGGSLR